MTSWADMGDEKDRISEMRNRSVSNRGGAGRMRGGSFLDRTGILDRPPRRQNSDDAGRMPRVPMRGTSRDGSSMGERGRGRGRGMPNGGPQNEARGPVAPELLKKKKRKPKKKEEIIKEKTIGALKYVQENIAGFWSSGTHVFLIDLTGPIKPLSPLLYDLLFEEVPPGVLIQIIKSKHQISGQSKHYRCGLCNTHVEPIKKHAGPHRQIYGVGDPDDVTQIISEISPTIPQDKHLIVISNRPSKKMDNIQYMNMTGSTFQAMTFPDLLTSHGIPHQVTVRDRRFQFQQPGEKFKTIEQVFRPEEHLPSAVYRISQWIIRNHFQLEILPHDIFKLKKSVAKFCTSQHSIPGSLLLEQLYTEGTLGNCPQCGNFTFQLEDENSKNFKLNPEIADHVTKAKRIIREMENPPTSPEGLLNLLNNFSTRIQLEIDHVIQECQKLEIIFLSDEVVYSVDKAREFSAKFRPIRVELQDENKERLLSAIRGSCVPDSHGNDPSFQWSRVHEISQEHRGYKINESTPRNFAEISIYWKFPRNLLEKIDEYGLTVPTDIQTCMMRAIMNESRDRIFQEYSGSGKTTGYIIAILGKLDFNLKSLQAVIIVPDQLLALQVSRCMISLSEDSGLEICRVRPQVSSSALSQAQVIICPLEFSHYMKNLKMENVKFLILDEIDAILARKFKISDLGIPNSVRTIGVCTTLPLHAASLISRSLPNSQWHISSAKISNLFPPNVVHSNSAGSDLVSLVSKSVKKSENGKTIVFCGSEHEMRELAENLTKSRIDFTTLTSDTQVENFDRFLRGETRTLLTTLSLRGISIFQVEDVIHVSFPSLEEYVHRSSKGAVNILKEEDYATFVKKVL
eukprot:TRINITY_DN6367_c1_g1_i1.p1 TRINITY_DN6367_c1_g1~~TRINITY_DN6367_c1_g1_i1.p1  ORF type:complete len:854 (-),score=319.93 TRINITY_DN6367_c1_g1_i1:54-2615(-)